jgi:hypothetical protein
MQSSTEKLPKGRTYPLKPMLLASALQDAGIAIRVTLTRWDKFDESLQARFSPDAWLPGQAGELIWVSCKAVSSNQAPAIRAAVESEGVARLIEWAKSIEALDARSPVRREQQTFTYPYPVLQS